MATKCSKSTIIHAIRTCHFAVSLAYWSTMTAKQAARTHGQDRFYYLDAGGIVRGENVAHARKK